MKAQEQTFCNTIATMVDSIYALIDKKETEWEYLGFNKDECLNTIKNSVDISLWVFFDVFDWGLIGVEDVTENFIIRTPTFEGGDNNYIVNLDSNYFALRYDYPNYSVTMLEGVEIKRAFEVLSKFSTTKDAITHCELVVEHFPNRVYKNILLILKNLRRL